MELNDFKHHDEYVTSLEVVVEGHIDTGIVHALVVVAAGKDIHSFLQAQTRTHLDE